MSEWAAITSIAAKLGIGTAETLRKSVRHAEIDAGARPGMSSEESAEVRRLRREVAELRRANEMLKAAAGFFARTRPATPDLVRSIAEPRPLRTRLSAYPGPLRLVDFCSPGASTDVPTIAGLAP